MTTPSTVLPRTEKFASLREMLEEQDRFRREQLTDLASSTAARGLTAAEDEVRATLVGGARAALRDVRAALHRMDKGEYGLCTTCGGPVERERLEILPHVARCLPCQRTEQSSTAH